MLRTCSLTAHELCKIVSVMSCVADSCYCPKPVLGQKLLNYITT